MERHELESAITMGIIKGGLILALLLSVIWLLLPTLIPIATLFLIEILEKWESLLVVVFMLVVMFGLVKSPEYFEDHYHKYGNSTFFGKIIHERILNSEGKITTFKTILLFTLYCSFFLFFIFGLSFLTMKRAVNDSDFIALFTCLIATLIFSFLVFRKSK